jgi:hypothetical protein
MRLGDSRWTFHERDAWDNLSWTAEARMPVLLWAAPGSPQLVTALDQHHLEPGLDSLQQVGHHDQVPLFEDLQRSAM